MEIWKEDIDCIVEDDYMFFYCPRCKKIYEMNECIHTIDDQRDSVNYYEEFLDCGHCWEKVKYVFTDEDDLREWLEDLVNDEYELPLNIEVITEKAHCGDDEYIKVINWVWK